MAHLISCVSLMLLALVEKPAVFAIDEDDATLVCTLIYRVLEVVSSMNGACAYMHEMHIYCHLLHFLYYGEMEISTPLTKAKVESTITEDT